MYNIIDLDKIRPTIYIVGCQNKTEKVYLKCWFVKNKLQRISCLEARYSKTENNLLNFLNKDLVNLITEAIQNEINIQNHIDRQYK